MYRANLVVSLAIDTLRATVRQSVTIAFPEWAAWERGAESLSDAELTEVRQTAIKSRDLLDARARDAASVRYAAECEAAVALRALIAAELAAVKADNEASIAADKCCTLASEAGKRSRSIRERLAALAA